MSLFLFILQCLVSVLHLNWLGRLKVSGCIAYILWDADCKIGLIKQSASLYSSHLAFILSLPLTFRWHNHRIVLTCVQFVRISILFYQRDQISIQFLTCQLQLIPYLITSLKIE